MTQLRFGRTWLHNTVKLAVVSWECHTPGVALKNLQPPCYTTVPDGQDPGEQHIDFVNLHVTDLRNLN